MKINCVACGSMKLSIDVIGINKKLLGSNINYIYCIDCLANYLEVTVEELLEKIEEFKEEGCIFFK